MLEHNRDLSRRVGQAAAGTTPRERMRPAGSLRRIGILARRCQLLLVSRALVPVGQECPTYNSFRTRGLLPGAWRSGARPALRPGRTAAGLGRLAPGGLRGQVLEEEPADSLVVFLPGDLDGAGVSRPGHDPERCLRRHGLLQLADQLHRDVRVAAAVDHQHGRSRLPGRLLDVHEPAVTPPAHHQPGPTPSGPTSKPVRPSNRAMSRTVVGQQLAGPVDLEPLRGANAFHRHGADPRIVGGGRQGRRSALACARRSAPRAS